MQMNSLANHHQKNRSIEKAEQVNLYGWARVWHSHKQQVLTTARKSVTGH